MYVIAKINGAILVLDTNRTMDLDDSDELLNIHRSDVVWFLQGDKRTDRCPQCDHQLGWSFEVTETMIERADKVCRTLNSDGA